MDLKEIGCENQVTRFEFHAVCDLESSGSWYGLLMRRAFVIVEAPTASILHLDPEYVSK
jgi:hypothetical protein